MTLPSLYLAGDSHAEGLSNVLPHAGQDFLRGRQTKGQPALPGALYDVVVVSLGTNDYDRNGLETEVRELAASRGGLPLVWVLPLHATRPDLALRRAAVTGHIRAGLEGVPGVVVVDPPVVNLPDGVHAARAGYVIIGREVELAARRAVGEGGAMVVPLVVGAVLAYAVWRWLK